MRLSTWSTTFPLGLLEADALVHLVHDLSVRIPEDKVQPVQRRGFRRPLLRGLHLRGEVHDLAAARADGDGAAVHLGDYLAVLGDGRFHLIAAPLHVKTAQSDGDAQVRVHEIRTEVGDDLPVPDPRLRRSVERDIVEDSRQPPVVLAFQVITVAVFEHQHGQGVLAGLEILRHIVFRRFLGAFVIADFLPVDPHERGRCDLLEAQEHLFALPILGQGESGSVGPCRIEFRRLRELHGEGRRILLGPSPEPIPDLLGRHDVERRGDIPEHGLAVPLHLPVGGNFDGPPLPVVEGRLEEIRRDLRRAFEIAELPGAVQGQGLRRDMESPAGLLILLEHGRVLNVIGKPVQIGLGAGGKRQRQQAEGKGLFHGH